MDEGQPELFAPTSFTIGEVERWCRTHAIGPVVGVDEAGRGPLAGPVYAAAVALDLDDPDDEWLELLDDSKKLSADRREEAYDLIRERALAWAVTHRGHDVIDDINILQATLRAMEEAIDRVTTELAAPPARVFIDGNQRVRTNCPQMPLVKGDGRSYAIAAASILAKVARDREMLGHHEAWPHYRFDSNKGYGTREHREAIRRHGPCPIHRRTFGGVREYLGG